ncbi:MAG: hypothetical protein ABIN37_08140 [Burkholderiaceae bacterium]
MSDLDALFAAVGTLAKGAQDLQRQAAQIYKPVVDELAFNVPTTSS